MTINLLMELSRMIPANCSYGQVEGNEDTPSDKIECIHRENRFKYQIEGRTDELMSEETGELLYLDGGMDARDYNPPRGKGILQQLIDKIKEEFNNERQDNF